MSREHAPATLPASTTARALKAAQPSPWALWTVPTMDPRRSNVRASVGSPPCRKSAATVTTMSSAPAVRALVRGGGPCSRSSCVAHCLAHVSPARREVSSLASIFSCSAALSARKTLRPVISASWAMTEISPLAKRSPSPRMRARASSTVAGAA